MNGASGTPDPAKTVSIAGLGGSLRPASSSRAALKVALDGAADAGAKVDLLDLRQLNLPMYDPSSDVVPESVTRFVEAVFAADGMIWSSPLYQGSISGSFKNALDWLILLGDREPPHLTDKVIGLISVAGGTQGLQAINTMEFIVRALRAWAVPLVIPIPQSWQAFEDTGRAANTQIEEPLKTLGGEVVRVTRRIAQKEVTDPGAACAAAAARLASVVGK
ncbi:MAG TPA: NAD(P)H-dependent oxidoreductase [Propionibacteriaceae bacterium]|nr:NAD(P)H-dependent oxidoreductase [Propionibacteriaceae bacterium]